MRSRGVNGALVALLPVLVCLLVAACGADSGPSDASEHRTAVTEKRQAISVATQSNRAGAAVRPIFECVRQMGPSLFEAQFGYENSTQSNVRLSPPHNRVIGNGIEEDPAVPIDFAPGRHEAALSVVFSDGQVRWQLGSASSVASPTMHPCPTPSGPPNVIPKFECVDVVGKERRAIFAYENTGVSPETIQPGTDNRLEGASPSAPQPPATFLPGHHRHAFSVGIARLPLTWHLAGRTATAPARARQCPKQIKAFAEQDSYVVEARPDDNFGDEEDLVVGERSFALVQFERAAIKERLGTARFVIGAKLILWLSPSSVDELRDPPIELRALPLLQRWTEGGATWSCSDDFLPQNGTTDCEPADVWTMTPMPLTEENPWLNPPEGVAPSSGQSKGIRVEFDVTDGVSHFLDAIRSNLDMAWIIQGTSSVPIRLKSRESRVGPRLVLQTATRPGA